MSINTWLGPIEPLPTVTPFTYRDGETQLELIERFRHYVNTVLVEFINTTFSEVSSGLTDEVNTLIADVNTALDTQTALINANNTTITNTVNADIATLTNTLNTGLANALNESALDPAMHTVINDAASATRILLNALYTGVSDAAVEAIIANGASATRAELNALFAPISEAMTDAGIETIINTGGSATRVKLDSLYASGGTFSDAAMNTILANGASASRTTLNAAFAPISTVSMTDAGIEAIVASVGSATRVELNSIYESKASLDADVATNLATGGSATKVALDATYLHSSALDAAIAALGASGGSATRVELDTIYAPHSTVSMTDAGIEAIVATGGSATRVELDTLYKQRGTAQTWVFASPAAMQASTALAAPPLAGDVATLAGDGTNFKYASFYSDGTNWHLESVIFVDDTASKWAAFVTYLALGTNTHILLAYGTGITANTGQQVIWNPILSLFTPNKLSFLRAVLNPITGIATGFTGTSATPNADGSMDCVALTAIVLAGLFPTKAIHGSIENTLRIVGSHVAASVDNMSIYNAGATAAGSWYSRGQYVLQTGVATAFTDLNDSALLVCNSTAGKYMDNTMEFSGVNDTSNANVKVQSMQTNIQPVATLSQDYTYKSNEQSATAWSVMYIGFGSAFTGKIWSFLR